MSRFASRLALVLALTAGLSLMIIPVANAYIDPGTGSVIFQAVIAGAMAAGLAVKVFWRRVKALLFRSAQDEEQGAMAEHEQTG